MLKKKHVSDANRFSIIQDDLSYCLKCGKPRRALHEVFNGNAERQKSKDYGMVVALCERHHSLAHRNGQFTRELKQMGQSIFEEKVGSREEFMRIFGRNYL